jgi:hypothetical protein
MFWTETFVLAWIYTYILYIQIYTVYRNAYSTCRCILYIQMYTVHTDMYCTYRYVLYIQMYMVHTDVHCAHIGKRIRDIQMYTVHTYVYGTYGCILCIHIYTRYIQMYTVHTVMYCTCIFSAWIYLCSSLANCASNWLNSLAFSLSKIVKFAVST